MCLHRRQLQCWLIIDNDVGVYDWRAAKRDEGYNLKKGHQGWSYHFHACSYGPHLLYSVSATQKKQHRKNGSIHNVPSVPLLSENCPSGMPKYSVLIVTTQAFRGRTNSRNICTRDIKFAIFKNRPFSIELKFSKFVMMVFIKKCSH